MDRILFRLIALAMPMDLAVRLVQSMKTRVSEVIDSQGDFILHK